MRNLPLRAAGRLLLSYNQRQEPQSNNNASKQISHHCPSSCTSSSSCDCDMLDPTAKNRKSDTYAGTGPHCCVHHSNIRAELHAGVNQLPRAWFSSSLTCMKSEMEVPTVL